MERRSVGGTDLSVSAIGLGGLNFGIIPIEQSRQVIDAALDLGINFIDTANVYASGASEEQLGIVLGARRKQVVLATKFGLTVDGRDRGASRRHIMEAIDASLRRLRTDWIDLYQLHMPDPETPMEDTLVALDEVVRLGKVRHIGCSNLAAWMLVDSLHISRGRQVATFCSAQDEYNLLARGAERELIPALESKGISLIPYFPLAGGMLSGKYKAGLPPPPNSRFKAMPPMEKRYATERNFRIVERLDRFAVSRGHTVLELALAWLVARKVTCSVIAGATSAAQVAQNAAAAAWTLSPQDMAEIGQISLG